MKMKQILLLTIILGFIANITLAEEQTHKHIPTHLHYEEFLAANNWCGITQKEEQDIVNRATKTLNDPHVYYLYAIGSFPNETGTCRLLIVTTKEDDLNKLEAAFEKAKEKHFK